MSQTILNLQTFANCPRWSYLVPNLPISDYLFIFVVQTVHIECEGDGIIEFHSILRFCYFLYHPVSSNLTWYLGNCLQPLLKNIYKGNMYVDPTRKMMIYFSIFLVLLSVTILLFQWFQFLVPHPKVVWTCETAPSWWTLMSFAPAVELRWIRKKKSRGLNRQRVQWYISSYLFTIINNAIVFHNCSIHSFYLTTKYVDLYNRHDIGGRKHLIWCGIITQYVAA